MVGHHLAGAVRADLDDAALIGEHNVDTTQLDYVIFLQNGGHIQEKTVSVVCMVNKLHGLLLLVDLLGLQDQVHLVCNILVLDCLLFICRFQERSPPRDELKSVFLEEVMRPFSQFLNSVPLEIVQVSVIVLLELTGTGGLETATLDALVDQPVGVIVHVADEFSTFVHDKLIERLNLH